MGCKIDDQYALSAGFATRRLAQDSTPLQFNITLGGISEISQQQAGQIKEALGASLTRPGASDIVVSSNTIVHDDMLTLIILVYPASDADAATLQSELEALGTGTTFTTFRDNLRSAGIQASSVTVNSVRPQPASQSVQRAPVTGSSLAGKSASCASRVAPDCILHMLLHMLYSLGMVFRTHVCRSHERRQVSAPGCP